jgi:hypothetical protein
MFDWKRRKNTSGRPISTFRPTVLTLEDRTVPSAVPTDPVLHWNEVAMQATVVDHGINAPHLQFGPTRASRAMAIIQGAVYDAVNSIDPESSPYLIQVRAPKGASLAAAVAEAAYTTLVSLYPYQKPFFDAELATALKHVPQKAEVDGLAVGKTVADFILAARTDDGSQLDAAGQTVNYTYGQNPGQWRADPLHPDATPLGVDWGQVKPFVIQSSTQFGAPPPPSITSLAYAQAYEQVKALGAADSTVRTDNETNIGFFWGYDAQPGICAPIRFYNQITEQVAEKMHNSTAENARLFALVNFAEADAAITCWGDKFNYDFWRPVTAIRENDPGTGPTGLGSQNPYLVGQGDPTWTPGGAPADNGTGTNFTPPFPSYMSGHASIGGATFKMVEDFYHTDVIPGGLTVVSDEFNTVTVDQNGNARPLLPRTYNSFSQMAGENAQSRVYLGIHWEFDAVEGIRCGDHIADYVFEHAAMPTHGPAPAPMQNMDPQAQIDLSVRLEDVAAHGGLRHSDDDHGGDDHGRHPAGRHGGGSGTGSDGIPGNKPRSLSSAGRRNGTGAKQGTATGPLAIQVFLGRPTAADFSATGHVHAVDGTSSVEEWVGLS